MLTIQVRHVEGLEYFAIYNEFRNLYPDGNFIDKIDVYLEKNDYRRYVRPSPMFDSYCTDYIENAIAYVTLEIGSPVFTVYEWRTSADLITKVGALGKHQPNPSPTLVVI